MIVVRIELWSAITGNKTVLGQMVIANDGTAHDPKLGDYTVFVGNKRNASDDPRTVVQNPQRKGRVENYPRLAYNVWRLVARALKSAFPEENKTNDIVQKKLFEDV